MLLFCIVLLQIIIEEYETFILHSIRGGRKKSMHRDSLSNDSGSILRISESILSLVFNQMCDDAEFYYLYFKRDPCLNAA